MSDVSTTCSLKNFLVRTLKTLGLTDVKSKHNSIYVGEEELFKIDSIGNQLYLTARTPYAIANNAVLCLLPKVLKKLCSYLKHLFPAFDVPVIWTTATGAHLDPVDWDWQLIYLGSDLHLSIYVRDDIVFFDPFLRLVQREKLFLLSKGPSCFCPYTLFADLTINFQFNKSFNFCSGSPASFQAANNVLPVLNIPMRYVCPKDVDVVQEIINDGSPELTYFKSLVPKYLVSTGHQRPEDVLKFVSLAFNEYSPTFQLQEVVFV